MWSKNSHPATRKRILATAFILGLLSLLPITATAAPPTSSVGPLLGPKSPPIAEPGQKWSYSPQTHRGQPGSIQPATTDTSCVAAAFAYPSETNDGIYSNGYLDCTGSTITYMGVDLELYRCYWGGTSYCGGMDSIGPMGDTCADWSGAGVVWCPDSNSYYHQPASNGCYMVQGFVGFIDADGYHAGTDTSQITCQ